MKIKRFKYKLTEEKILDVQPISGEWYKGSTKWSWLIKAMHDFLLAIPNILEHKEIKISFEEFKKGTQISIDKLEEYLKDTDKRKLEYDIEINKDLKMIFFKNFQKTKKVRYVHDS